MATGTYADGHYEDAGWNEDGSRQQVWVPAKDAQGNELGPLPNGYFDVGKQGSDPYFWSGPYASQAVLDPATGNYSISPEVKAASEQYFKQAGVGGSHDFLSNFMSSYGPLLVGGIAGAGILGAGGGLAGAGEAAGGIGASDLSSLGSMFETGGTGIAGGGGGLAGGGFGGGAVDGISAEDLASLGQTFDNSGTGTLADIGGDGFGGWGTNEAAGATGLESSAGGSISGNTGLLQNLAKAFGMTGADGSISPTTLLSLSNLLGGVGGALASRSAANTQANASNNATAAQLAMFNTINQQQAPWRQAGANALGTIGDMQGYFNHQFDANDLKTNLAPNYQFQLDQGLGATKNAMNLQGGFAGNTLKGINDYAQNFAGNAYQQAFNNYSTNQSNIFNRLSSIAGLGQTANASTAQAGTTAAQNAGQSMQNAGAAQAAGTVGASNALAGGLTNAASWYALPQLLSGSNLNG